MAGKHRNIWYNVNKYVFSILPDKLYHNLIGLIMHKRFGIKYHWMDIRNPKTFSEKLQYLKTNPVADNLNELADKYDVRDFVKSRIGEQHLVPLVGKGVYSTVDEIDFNELPNQFVLKLTKGSGYNIICSDKTKLDVEDTKSTLAKWIKVNPYYMSREKQYKGRNRFIAEQMIANNITDYKFFCFNGKPEFVELIIDRIGELKKVFMDMNWESLDLTTGNSPTENSASKPMEFDIMKNISSQLAKDFAFVRVDLYAHEDKVYFGEMTFYPAGGYTPITPREWEYRLGEMLKLD